MTMKTISTAAICVLLALPTAAQENGAAVDCSLEANKELAECLELPNGGEQITNAVPLVAPVAGVFGAIGLLGGGGGSGTVSTTSTTGTN